MSTIPSGYRKVIDPLISTARDILEHGEPLQPMVFVGNLSTGETTIVPLDTGSEQAKDDAARLARHLAAQLEADFVFNIMDSWGLDRRADRLACTIPPELTPALSDGLQIRQTTDAIEPFSMQTP